MKRIGVIIAAELVFVLPLAVLALSAAAAYWTFPDILPRRFDTRALEYLAFNRAGILSSLASSAAYSLAVVMVTGAMCLLPARLLARSSVRGRRLLEGVLLAPALLPVMVFAFGAQQLFLFLRIADTPLAVILVLAVHAFPYMLRALTAGYTSFGPEGYLAARNLGGSRRAAFRAAELPQLVPALAAGASVVFLVAFSDYFLVFLAGGGVVPSFTGYLFPFLNSSERNIASALSLVFLLVPLMLFAVLNLLIRLRYGRTGVRA